jgi:hypothetical protein
MKRNYDMALLESMILSNKIRLTEAPCVFPAEWNQAKGDKFRAWFLKTHADKAKQLNLDASGPYNNSTMLNAYCYNPYGLETAGDRFMMLSADEGGGASDNWSPLGISPMGWLSIGIACMVVLGIGWLKYRKVKAGVRIAREVAKQAKNYPGGKAQMLEDALDTIKDKSKRGSYLSKFLKSKSLTQEERKAAEAALENPGVISAEQKIIHGMLYEEFKNGNISASDLIDLAKMNPTSQEARMLKAIERARKKSGNKKLWPSEDQLKKWKTKQTNKRTNAPKRTYKPIENSKLRYYTNPKSTNFENAWFHLKGSVTPADVETAINRTMTQMEVSFKQSAQLRSTATLSAEAISKRLSSKGNFMLAKHANAQTFPPFNTWMREMNAAGVKPQVSPGDMARYAKNHTIWNLIHRR